MLKIGIFEKLSINSMRFRWILARALLAGALGLAAGTAARAAVRHVLAVALAIGLAARALGA